MVQVLSNVCHVCQPDEDLRVSVNRRGSCRPSFVLLRSKQNHLLGGDGKGFKTFLRRG